MGVLDYVFDGEKGLSAVLHEMFGAQATIRIKSFERDEKTGSMIPSFVEYEVPFIPNPLQKTVVGLNAPNASRSDVRVGEYILSGTFPKSAVNAVITPEKDTIVVDGIEYMIQSLELLKVGSKEVQYSITAKRC